MRIEQMRAREPYEQTLLSTLSRGWSQQLGRPVSVGPADTATGQLWRLQPILSAYVCPPSSRAMRRFLASTFRFTPNRRRALPQFAAAGLLTTNLGLLVGTTPAFRVDPGLPNAADVLVQPGNQRIRVFDLERAQTRVFVKEGFSTATMRNEISVRSQDGPFLPVIAADPDGSWLEEPLVDAWALPRCPPWVNRQDARREAMRQLDEWLRQTAQPRDARDVAAQRALAIEELAAKLNARFPGTGDGLAQAVRPLSRLVAQMGTVMEAASHGDLQPGNILVSRHWARGGRAVWLIDWEHSGRRSIDYDRFTFGLQTRNRGDLASTWRAYLDGDERPPELSHLRTDLERRAALALFVLEDLAFFMSESLTGPYSRPSEGLGRVRSSLHAVALAHPAGSRGGPLTLGR